MTDKEKVTKKFKLGTVFTPSAPIEKSTLFAGRRMQINKLINAVNQKGQHAILFGERGVGKTSLAVVLKDYLAQFTDILVMASTNCDAGSNFASIWKSVLNQLPVKIAEIGMGFNPTTHESTVAVKEILPKNPAPEDIRQALEQVEQCPVIIIDEIDRIKDRKTTTAIADTIKTLSDHATKTTLILVGVSDSVNHLIGEHQSIERALVQIPMPRMSREELMEIIEKGLHEVKMTAGDEAKCRIAKLSHGLPHYTHLLGLNAAQSAVDRDSLEVTNQDVTSAIESSIEQAQQSIVHSYHQATSSPRGNLYSEVLLACALAKTDDLGYFPTPNVREPMSKIMKKPYDIPAFSRHLNDFCEHTRGKILQRSGFPRRYKFRFVNPLMEPYIVMKGISKKLISPEELESLT